MKGAIWHSRDEKWYSPIASGWSLLHEHRHHHHHHHHHQLLKSVCSRQCYMEIPVQIWFASFWCCRSGISAPFPWNFELSDYPRLVLSRLVTQINIINLDLVTGQALLVLLTDTIAWSCPLLFFIVNGDDLPDFMTR